MNVIPYTTLEILVPRKYKIWMHTCNTVKGFSDSTALCYIQKKIFYVNIMLKIFFSEFIVCKYIATFLDWHFWNFF